MRRGGYLAGLAWTAALLAGAGAQAQGNDRVAFPAAYAEGVHYATVTRGDIREELYTSRAAIEAAQRGEPIPDGTVILMEDYRGGRLHRYVAMEKRAGWGERHAPEVRNGDWEFQAFLPDRSVNREERVTRCMGCHKAQAGTDFLFTLDRMKAAPLSEAGAGMQRALAQAPLAPASAADLTHAQVMLSAARGR